MGTGAGARAGASLSPEAPNVTRVINRTHTICTHLLTPTTLKVEGTLQVSEDAVPNTLPKTDGAGGKKSDAGTGAGAGAGGAGVAADAGAAPPQGTLSRMCACVHAVCACLGVVGSR